MKSQRNSFQLCTCNKKL